MRRLRAFMLFWAAFVMGSGAAQDAPRRTLRGLLPPDVVGLPALVTPYGHQISSGVASPACVIADVGIWECAGIPADEPVVVIFDRRGEVLYGVAPAASESVQWIATQAARSGRLMYIEGSTAGGDPDLQVVPKRPKRSRLLVDVSRVTFQTDDDTTVIKIGAHTFWIAATRATLFSETVLDVSGASIGRFSVRLEDVWDGPRELAVVVSAHEPIQISGTVIADDRRPVPFTPVSLFERWPVRRDSDDPHERRTRWLAEAVTDESGRFVFDGLSAQPYELVAVHPRWGRAEADATVSRRVVTLRLERSAQIQGRVVRDGRPQVGVPVRLIPTAAALPRMSDPLDYVSGSTLTDRLGRFSIGLPPQGASQLIIGSPDTARVRRTVPAADGMPPVTDLGDISLSATVEVLAELQALEGCDLFAIGPMGTRGLAIVRGEPHPSGLTRFAIPEFGHWWLSAVCHGRELQVVPPLLRVSEEDVSRVVQVRAFEQAVGR